MENLQLLNLKEVAAALRVSVPTIRIWTYKRRIPVVKLGTRCLYRREDLEAFVKKNLRESDEDYLGGEDARRR